MSPRRQRFGGPWTDEKLDKLGRYLQAYVTALKHQGFNLMYIDAFAGTGYREKGTENAEAPALFDDDEMNELAKGSARVALGINPPFERYVFIDSEPENIEALKELGNDYPSLRHRMEFICRDANDAIGDLCKGTDWRKTRAVAFLDPFAMEVAWATIKVIAATEKIDLWYLFPYMAVNRVMAGHGEIPPESQARLDRVLPDQGWRSEFYAASPQESFDFVEGMDLVRDAGLNRLKTYLLDHLGDIFPGVARYPLVLKNTKDSPLFLFFFACGNPSPPAQRLALELAEHILAN